MTDNIQDFDAIVVGAGPAGCAAAYQLAKAKLSVVLIERGQAPGGKNLSGGVLYSAVLNELIPDFYTDAPVERPITRHATTFLTEDSSCSLEYRSTTLGSPPYNAFSVLRSKFDAWFADVAERGGALLMPGIRVDAPLIESGVVVGIRAGEETLRARAVVAADGVNSFLAQAAGLRPRNAPATSHSVLRGSSASPVTSSRTASVSRVARERRTHSSATSPEAWPEADSSIRTSTASPSAS